MTTINCALDGPGGAGKSTIAKAVAKQLGYIYVDTGALYRSIGLYCIRNGIDPRSCEQVEPELANISVELGYIDNEQRVFLNGEDVSGLIRTGEISMAASNVSAIPCVREFLLNLQRDIAKKNNIIMDGRDIGTVILPDAQVKIFMTASAEVRAKRRYDELLEKGQEVTYENVLKEINERDYNDSHRATAPLKQADDAVLLDTSDMGIEEAVAAVVKIIGEKTSKPVEEVKEDFFPEVKPERKQVSAIRCFFYAIVRMLVSVWLHIIYNIKYENKENIPKGGSFIITPNHIHWADPILVAVAIRNPSSYMAKESIFKNKLLAVLVKLFNAFPVKRDSSDRGALNTAMDYLERGYNLTIFPEGTRSKDGKLGKGKSGVAYIASLSGADVLPVGIIMKKKKHHRKYVTVRFGKLIPNGKLKMEAMSASEMRRCRDIIMNEIGALCGNER